MVSHNLEVRVGKMRLARYGFPVLLLHRASVVAAVLSSKLRIENGHVIAQLQRARRSHLAFGQQSFPALNLSRDILR